MQRRTIPKKCLNDLDNHDGMVTHLEPDILECKVKWALGSITMNKASGGDGILGELLQILRGAALNMPANLENSAVVSSSEQDQKRSFFTPIPKKGNAKECSNYHIIVFISHTSTVMFKILQARHQQYLNLELPEVQGGFRKGRG